MSFGHYSPTLVAKINEHAPHLKQSGLNYVCTAMVFDQAIGPLQEPGAQVRKTPDGKLDSAYYNAPKMPEGFDRSMDSFSSMHYALAHMQGLEKIALRVMDERKDLDPVSKEALATWTDHLKRVLPIPMLRIAECCITYMQDKCPTEERTVGYLGTHGPKERKTLFNLDDSDNRDCAILAFTHSHNAFKRYRKDEASFKTDEDRSSRLQNMEGASLFMRLTLPSFCDHEYFRAKKLMETSEKIGWDRLAQMVEMGKDDVQKMVFLSLMYASNGTGMLAEVSDDNSLFLSGREFIIAESKNIAEKLGRLDLFDDFFAGGEHITPIFEHALPHDKYRLLEIKPEPQLEHS